MKIFLTGVTGYIGRRLLPVLLEEGHIIICGVRSPSRFDYNNYPSDKIRIIQYDALNPDSIHNIPKDIDASYYLIHSLDNRSNDFAELEEKSALNFKQAMEMTSVKQVIYLSGIVNDKVLSPHLSSRKKVEDILQSEKYNFTCLRAGIIVGSGSASFEIIRDLVEKLPIMIAPKWILTKSQPIAIRNVIQFLSKSLLNTSVYNKSYDIYGPSVLSYKEMLLQYADVRGLKRWIINVPVLTPKLSSYWLYFVTATSYKLASNLVDSMKVEVIASPNDLAEKLEINTMTYEEAINAAFLKIEQNEIVSSWKDSFISSGFEEKYRDFIKVPSHGCLIDKREMKCQSTENAKKKIWAIGGQNGWYYGNMLWKIRGYLDKIFGGVGLRRGRTNLSTIKAGDALDFWRVILADEKEGRLLLYAEMKLPGEAWLEFKVGKGNVIQTATFRPKGLIGLLYWYSLVPFHNLVFNGMLRNIVKAT